MGNLGGTEIFLIVFVVLFFFGAKKLPDLARGLGKGIKEFKDGMKEVTEIKEEEKQITK
jgi:sec-independent protein translocase protein TatA